MGQTTMRRTSMVSGMPMGGGQVFGWLTPAELASTSICFPGPRLRGQFNHTS